jgi:hypothetical protein
MASQLACNKYLALLMPIIYKTLADAGVFIYL